MGGTGAAVFDVSACVPLGVDTATTVVDCANDFGELIGEAVEGILVVKVVFTGIVLDIGGDGAAETDVVVVETAWVGST